MDSINTAIIDLLWQKPHGTENRIFIPIAETIFYRHRLPLRWYFTSFSGELKRKHKTNCSTAAIAASFIPPDKENDDDIVPSTGSGKPNTNSTNDNDDNQSTTNNYRSSSSSSCDILAVWFGGVPVDDIPSTSPANPNSNSNNTPHNNTTATSTVPHSSSNEPLNLNTYLGLSHSLLNPSLLNGTTTENQGGIRFLASKEELQEFLVDPHKETSGVLQKFVVPKGERNEVLRCTWSSNVTLVEKRTCLAKLHDTKHAAVSARSLTYETSGADASAPQSTVRSNYLIAQLQKLSESIVGHVAAVTERRVMVSTLTTNWKLDSKDRLVLLWVSGVTVRPNPVDSTVPLGLPLNATTTANTSSRPSSRSTLVRPKSSQSLNNNTHHHPTTVNTTNTNILALTKENIGPLDIPVPFTSESRSLSSSPVPEDNHDNQKNNTKIKKDKNSRNTITDKDKQENSDEVRTEVMNVIRRAHSAATLRPLPTGNSNLSSTLTSIEKIIEQHATETLCPPRSSLVTPQGSHTLPLGGIIAHKKALKQREMERVAAQLGKFIVHDPVWECPSCGQVSNAHTLETISLEIIIHHYQAVLHALHLRPRELFARRDSENLPKECYWPNNVAQVQTVAGGIGIYFAYLMPKNYVRQPISIPYSMGFYLDKWLFQRDISSDVAKASSSVSIMDNNNEFLPPHANYSSLSPPQQRIQELSSTIDGNSSAESQEELQSLIRTTKRAAFDIESAVKLQNENPHGTTNDANSPNTVRKRSGPRTLQHLAFGLSPNGLPVVRKIPPTIARAFPEMTVIQYQGFVTNNYTLPTTVSSENNTPLPVGNTNTASNTIRKNSAALPAVPLPYTTSLPICGDCFVTYRVFGDGLLAGIPDNQALSIASARFAKVTNKISTSDHSSVNESTNYSHRPGSTRTQNSILHKNRPTSSASASVLPQGTSTQRLRRAVTSAREPLRSSTSLRETKQTENDEDNGEEELDEKITGSTRSSIHHENKEDTSINEPDKTRSMHSSMHSSSSIQHYPLVADNKNVLNDIIQTYYNHTNENEDNTNGTDHHHNTGDNYTNNAYIPVNNGTNEHDDTFFMSPDRVFITDNNNSNNNENKTNDDQSSHPHLLPSSNQIHPFPSLDSALSADMMSQITDATDMRYYQPSASGMVRSQTSDQGIDDGDEGEIVHTTTTMNNNKNPNGGNRSSTNVTSKPARNGSGGSNNRPTSSSSTSNKRTNSATNSNNSNNRHTSTTAGGGGGGRQTPVEKPASTSTGTRNITNPTETNKTVTTKGRNNHAPPLTSTNTTNKTPRPVSASKAQDIRYRRQHKPLLHAHDNHNGAPSNAQVPDGDGIIDIDALTLDGDDPDVALATFTMLKKQKNKQLLEMYDTTSSSSNHLHHGNRGSSSASNGNSNGSSSSSSSNDKVTNRPQTAKPNLGRDSYHSNQSNTSLPKDGSVTNNNGGGGGSRTTTSSSSHASSHRPSRQPTPIQDLTQLPTINTNDTAKSTNYTTLLPLTVPGMSTVPLSSSGGTAAIAVSLPGSQNISRSSSASNLLFNPSASLSGLRNPNPTAMTVSSSTVNSNNGTTHVTNTNNTDTNPPSSKETPLDPLEVYRKDLMQRLSTLGSIPSVSATLPGTNNVNGDTNTITNNENTNTTTNNNNGSATDTVPSTMSGNNNNNSNAAPSSVSSSLASGASISRVQSAGLTSNSALPSVFQTVLENAMNSFQQSLRSISIASVVGGNTYSSNNNNASGGTGSSAHNNGSIHSNHNNPIAVPLLEGNPSSGNTTTIFTSPTHRNVRRGGPSSASRNRTPGGRTPSARTRTPNGANGSRASTATTMNNSSSQNRGNVLQFDDTSLSPYTSRATSANTMYGNMNTKTGTGSAYHLHSRASTATQSRPTSTGSLGMSEFYSNRTRESDIWTTNTNNNSNNTNSNRLVSPAHKLQLRPASSHATLENNHSLRNKIFTTNTNSVNNNNNGLLMNTNGSGKGLLSTVPESYRGEESINEALSVSSKIRPYSALPGLGSSSSSSYGNTNNSIPSSPPPSSSSSNIHSSINNIPTAPSRYTMPSNENHEPLTNDTLVMHPSSTGVSSRNLLSPTHGPRTSTNHNNNAPAFASPSRSQGFQINTGPASLAMMREELRRKEEIEEEKRQAQRSLMRNLSIMAKNQRKPEQPISNRTYDRLLGSSAMAMRAARERVANDPSLLQEVLSKATKR